jgi:hypothetical protein
MSKAKKITFYFNPDDISVCWDENGNTYPNPFSRETEKAFSKDVDMSHFKRIIRYKKEKCNGGEYGRKKT